MDSPGISSMINIILEAFKQLSAMMVVSNLILSLVESKDLWSSNLLYKLSLETVKAATNSVDNTTLTIKMKKVLPGLLHFTR